MRKNTVADKLETTVMALRGARAMTLAVRGFYTLINTLKGISGSDDTSAHKVDEMTAAVDTLALSMSNVDQSALKLLQKYGSQSTAETSSNVSHVLKLVVSGVRTVAGAYRLIRNLVRSKKVNQYVKRLKVQQAEVPKYVTENLGVGVMGYVKNAATLGVNAFKFVNGIRTGNTKPKQKYENVSDYIGGFGGLVGAGIDTASGGLDTYKELRGNDVNAKAKKPLAENMVQRMKQKVSLEQTEQLGDFYESEQADVVGIETNMLEKLDDLDVEFFSGLNASPRSLIRARSNPEFLRIIALGMK